MHFPPYAVPILFLAGCTHVVEPPPPQIAGHRLVTADPSAMLMLKCDALGFPRASDGHRLCVMRGIDRLEAQPLYRDPCGFSAGGCSGIPPGTHLTVIPPTATHSFQYRR